MPDNTDPNEGTTPPDTNEYLKVIQELKKNSVSKEKYDSLREENRQLLQSIVNGKEPEEGTEQLPPDINALRKELFSEDNHMNNLDYAKKALELRTALIESGQDDPFLPVGYKISPDNIDTAAAKKVADVLQECIEYAQGDGDVFTNELQRRMLDTPTMHRRN